MFELARFQQHRHAIVHFRNEFVWLADDHGTRFHALTRLAVLPFIPEARDREHRRPVTRCEVPGLLALRRVLPLVIARNGHEATLALERLTEEPSKRNSLGTDKAIGSCVTNGNAVPDFRRGLPDLSA